MMQRLAPERQVWWMEVFSPLGKRLRGAGRTIFLNWPPDLTPTIVRGEPLPTEVANQIFDEGGLEPRDKINAVLACHRFSNRDIEWMTGEKI